MKKLAILFLLTAVLVSFSFAQVSVKADFSLGNLTEGNDGKMDPALALTFDGAAAKELGPGTLGLAGEITYVFSFQDKDGATPAAHYINGDNFIKGSYALAAGPGTLTFWLKYKIDGAWILEPGAEYAGIAAGPATIGVGAYFDWKFSGLSKFDDTVVPIVSEKGAFSDGTKIPDVFGIYVTAGFDFGLNIKYEFQYQLDHDASIAQIAYLDVNYKVMDPLVVGVELDNTASPKGSGYDVIFKGFQLKPYATYTLNDNVSLGAYFKISNIAPDKDKGQPEDMMFTPGVWVKYTF